MVTKYCSVFSCIHYRGCRDVSIKFFRTPKNADLAKKWRYAIWGDEETPNNFTLCELHFSERDIVRRRNLIQLYPNAIPFPPIDSVTLGSSSNDFGPEQVEYDDDIGEAAGQMELKSSETAGMCVGCIHQDVKIQDTSMKLNNKFNKLNETCDKQDTILRKLRAEVKLLRKWAKLKKLTPPSPPASPTPRNVHIELALDSKYGHFKLKREQPQQLKTYGAKKRKDEANGFDNMETAGSAFGSTIDLLAIEGELKMEAVEQIDAGNISQHNTTNTKSSKTLVSKPFECVICGKRFKFAENLKVHVSAIHTNTEAVPHLIKRALVTEVQETECYLCRRQFKGYSGLRLHMNSKHTKPQKKRCKICDEFYMDETHSCAGLKLDCEYCSAQFDSLHRLTAHLDGDHVKKLLYGCIVCSRSFEMRSFLEHHKSKHLPGEFACTECSEKFDSKKHLKRHRRHAHMTKRPHLCDECGKSFQTSQGLDTHKKGHGEKRLKCTKCPYTTTAEHNLRRHILDIHSNSTQIYSCDVCSKQFTRLASLKKHVVTHTYTEADRTHACNLCPAKFHQAHSVRKHVRTVHKNVGRSFNCTHCDKSYKHSGDLNKHLRSHLGDKMYKCPDCPEAFRMPFELKRHSYKHYEEDGVDRGNTESATSNQQ